MLFWPIFGNFWCLVVILLTFSGNLSNFERNQKNKKIQKKPQKIKKNQKIQKSQKIQKIQKYPKKIKKEIQKKREKKYPLSFPILGGRDSTRALQSSPFQKCENLKKSPKFTFFKFFLLLKKKLPTKKIAILLVFQY